MGSPLFLLLPLLAQQPAVATKAADPRADYDVQAYRLDLAVDPDTKTLSGTVAVALTVTRDGLDEIVLDLKPGFDVTRVDLLLDPFDATGILAGTKTAFEHEKSLLRCSLAGPAKAGESVSLAVTYSGKPVARDSFSGFHWAKTQDGRPWIGTSCQDDGSASWWPSKDSFFHPEDKPARVFENYTVPKGLYAVGNGRLTAREPGETTETFRWVHEYPLETYTVTLNVAPYVVVEQVLDLEGPEGKAGAKVPFFYYVLPENAEKAALQFQDVPAMMRAFETWFGPFPFPKSKFALVETSFWGMEHSTAIAYGSSYPAWLAVHGGKDPYSGRNKLFDYILVHESAHEWWGNAVSARTWGDFWIHEGFATYAEAVYLEELRGAAVAQKHMDSWKSGAGAKSRLFRGENVDSGAAYSNVIYAKGAWVLHTLRQYVDDDAAFKRAIRAFNMEHRYGNASTRELRQVVERETKRDWQRFFDEWVYGAGFPRLSGSVTATGSTIRIDVTNTGSSKDTFHVPLDLAWESGGVEAKERVWLAPGKNARTIEAKKPVSGLRLRGLERILCESNIRQE